MHLGIPFSLNATPTVLIFFVNFCIWSRWLCHGLAILAVYFTSLESPYRNEPNCHFKLDHNLLPRISTHCCAMVQIRITHIEDLWFQCVWLHSLAALFLVYFHYFSSWQVWFYVWMDAIVEYPTEYFQHDLYGSTQIALSAWAQFRFDGYPDYLSGHYEYWEVFCWYHEHWHC